MEIRQLRMDEIEANEEITIQHADDFADCSLEDLAQQINNGHQAVEFQVRRMAGHVAQVGAWLVAAKAKCKHGDWLDWLADNCPEISRYTSSRYMKTYVQLISKANGSNVARMQHMTPTQAYKALGIVRDVPSDELADVEDEKDGASLCALSEWKQVADETQRVRLINDAPNTNRKFNLQADNDSIEWARLTWNPITGCFHDCDYCYAADFAARWTNVYPNGFEPTIIPERLYAPANSKQKDLSKLKEVDRTGWKNVFVCSMADLFGKWVPEAWINAVLNVIRENPQWNYLMLTKFPIRMSQFEYPDNVWLGTTVDSQSMVARAEKAFQQLRDSKFSGITWLSCEPLLEPLTFERLDLFDWLVIGGRSKTTGAEVLYPDHEWIEDLKSQAGQYNLPVYEKTNLRFRQREYPKAIHTTKPKQKSTLEAQIIEPTKADQEGQLLMGGLLKERVVQDGEAESR
jgi:protein gp37